MFQKLKVLVADDNQMMRSLVADGLRKMEIEQIDIVDNGEDALSAINSAAGTDQPYHIAFLDWHMPEMTGFDVLLKCREDKSLDQMAVVMLTAEQEQSNVLKAIQSGATAYLIKPVSRDALKSNMEKVLKWFEKNNIKI